MSRYYSLLLLLSLLVVGQCSIQLNLDRVSINPKQDGSPADDDVYVYKAEWGVQRFPINTAIDISSSSTFLIDSTCEGCLDKQVFTCENKCQKVEVYCNVADSMVNDGLEVQFTQNGKKQTCQVGYDTLRFGKFDVSPIAISFPSNLTGYQAFYKTIPASIGAGLKGSSDYRTVQTSFIDSLAAAKFRIEQNTVSFTFGAQRGIAIFGKPDSIYTQNKNAAVELYSPKENSKSPLKTAPLFSSFVASVKVAEKEEITLKDLTLQQNYHAYFSTTTKFIQISDKDLLTKIKAQIQEKANLGACKDSATLIDCELRESSVFPDIKFNFQVSADDTLTLVPVLIKGEDYVEKYQTTDGKKRVLVLFKVKDQLISADSVSRDQIIFGEPFFRSNFVTFNHDNRRISIQPAPTIAISDKAFTNNSNSTILVIAGLIIVALSTAILLSLFKNVEYTPTTNYQPKTPKQKSQPLFQTLPPNNQQIIYTPVQKQIIIQQQPQTIQYLSNSPSTVFIRQVNASSNNLNSANKQ